MIGSIRLLALFACLATPAWCDTLVVNGVARTFAAQLPDQKSAPLVIVLHGKNQQGIDMATRTAWPHVARRERFAVVFPDGLNRAWADLRPASERIGRLPPKDADDVAFITALINAFVRNGVADPKRIYVTGVSNGGAMTMTMACTRADLLAAAASVVMDLTTESANICKPSRPIPMLMMNGTADPLVPYDGGGGSDRFAASGFWSTSKTLGFWREINGCDSKDARSEDLENRDPSDDSTVTRIMSRCPAGRDVLLYRINDGGHRMPGFAPDARFPRAVDALLGPQNHDIDGAETIWAFFKRFP